MSRDFEDSTAPTADRVPLQRCVSKHNKMVPVRSLRATNSPRSRSADQVRTMAAQDIPPIGMRRQSMLMVDGLHRPLACVEPGGTAIRARYFSGSTSEAFLYAVEANVRVGMPLSRGGRRLAGARPHTFVHLNARSPATTDGVLMYGVDPAVGDGRALRARLTDFATAPPQTRMLVCADGSTTVLLEALVCGQLTVEVADQYRARADGVGDVDHEMLGVPSAATVVDRHSRILTPGGEVISVNRVVFAGRASAALVPPEHELLGPYLSRIGVSLRRVPIGAVPDTWPLGRATNRCVRKDYIIDCGDAGRVYVRERFNPSFVPLGAVRETASEGGV